MDRKQEDRRRRARRRNRGISKAINTLSYIIMILGVSLLIAAFGILLANDMFALIKEDAPVQLVLDAEADAGQVAEILTDNDVIAYGWAFKLYAKMQGVEAFPAGAYTISAGMDYGQIINAMIYKAVVRDVKTVTIPEGFSIRQIAALMDENGVCSAEDFIATCNDYRFSHAVLKDVPIIENRLEGYLFPDTYQFYVDDQPVNVINKMLNNFVNKITPEMRHLMDNNGVTLDKVIVIASLIEREAKIADERRAISGVIYNRLNNPEEFPHLEIDATLLYTLPEHKGRLTAEDREVDSPYNTYIITGLPPTAICNPGLSAIMAAIAPEQNDYYYYVVSDLDTGSHAFAETYRQHQRNVEAYYALLDAES
jgi:UPF0755 protein